MNCYELRDVPHATFTSGLLDRTADTRIINREMRFQEPATWLRANVLIRKHTKLSTQVCPEAPAMQIKILFPF